MDSLCHVSGREKKGTSCLHIEKNGKNNTQSTSSCLPGKKTLNGITEDGNFCIKRSGKVK